MKARTLNQTWTLCLRMWRSISKGWNKRKSVSQQKRLWTKENGFAKYGIAANCFFCDYDEYKKGSCRSCPGKLVDPDFDCCDSEYHYRNPVAFYHELLRLNRIRKAK